MKIIIYNPKTFLFDFFIISLIQEFNKLNIEIQLNNNVNNNNNISNNNISNNNISNNNISNNINNKDIDYNKDILLIIINPHFIVDCKDIKNEIIQLSKQYRYKVLYITEPINFIVEKKVYQDIIKIINPFALWTYTYDNFNKLNTHMPLFKIYPINNTYNFIDIYFENIKSRRTDKIVFIGNITQNRIDICKSFGNDLINYDNSWTIEEWTKILSNNIIYLNIHRRVGCKSFEYFRIIPLLANGCFIISERCNLKEEELFKDYNIIFVERNELLNTFLKYKNNISYEEVYNKSMLFRNNFNKDNAINDFIEYYNNIFINS